MALDITNYILLKQHFKQLKISYDIYAGKETLISSVFSRDIFSSPFQQGILLKIVLAVPLRGRGRQSASGKGLLVTSYSPFYSHLHPLCPSERRGGQRRGSTGTGQKADLG
jgi:hypothetical protein